MKARVSLLAVAGAFKVLHGYLFTGLVAPGPILDRQTRRREETRTLSVSSFVMVLIGLAVLPARGAILAAPALSSAAA